MTHHFGGYCSFGVVLEKKHIGRICGLGFTSLTLIEIRLSLVLREAIMDELPVRLQPDVSVAHHGQTYGCVEPTPKVF